ncbi:MAG: YcjF family protein [Acidaminococcaceae bacterium]|jgi:uncharacterized protein (DUF697 family)|nr:YcjF family protein [Acidaminococcaceae bacterium]
MANENEEKVTVIDDKEREEAAEKLCKWATARAGVIVIMPGLGTVAMLANQIYMVVKLGKVYEQKITEAGAVSILGSMGTYFAGKALLTLIPFAPLQLPIAMGTTYGLGKAVTSWLQAGRPKDFSKFKDIYTQAVDEVKKNVDKFKNDPHKDEPLGDESKKFTK